MNDNRVNIAYIGGGSREWGWRFIAAAADEELCAMVKLYDIDKDCALANEVIGNNIHDACDTRGNIIYLACDTAEEALRNADFVITSFEAGQLDELVTLLHFPEGMGINQTDGENSGLCSIVRALKMMPLCADYARMIAKLCPNAWVINLCTPLAECMTVMREAFPAIKLIGADNTTFDTRQFIASLLCVERDVKGIRRRDIKTNVIGISGFSWFDSIYAGGEDLMPMFRDYAEKYSDSGYEFRVNEFKTNPFADAHKVKFDLFLRYGLIPAVPDRVAAEFCPPWYTKTPKTMAAWKFSPITVSYKKKQLSDRASRVKRYMEGERLPKSLIPTEVPSIIRALCGGGNFIASINTFNRGQALNLPADTVVVSNALISRGEIRPVAAGELPEGILGLSLRHISNRRQTVEAYKKRDLDIAFNAFLNDPVNICSITESTGLYREMLAAVRNHLLYYLDDKEQ